jgi:hypothetical protein
MGKTKKPRILHSGSYWQDFHQRRAERQRRAAQYGSEGQGGSGNRHYDTSGSLQSPPLIVTFIPNRDAPLYTLVQNDGSLVTSYDALSIQPTPPPTTGMATDPALPARREAPQPYRNRRQSAALRRAEERLRARPTEDEILLERLTKGSK